MVDALVTVGMMSTLPCSQDKSERSGFKVFGTVSFPTTAAVSGFEIRLHQYPDIIAKTMLHGTFMHCLGGGFFSFCYHWQRTKVSCMTCRNKSHSHRNG